MIAALGVVHWHPTPAKLRGAHAPAAWRRERARLFARLVAACQLCDWIADLVRIRVELTNGPLFGTCLIQLTQADGLPDVAKVGRPSSRNWTRELEEGRSADCQPNWQERTPPTQAHSGSRGLMGEILTARNSFNGGTRSEAPWAVSHLPPQASLSFLQRVSGGNRVGPAERGAVASERGEPSTRHLQRTAEREASERGKPAGRYLQRMAEREASERGEPAGRYLQRMAKREAINRVDAATRLPRQKGKAASPEIATELQHTRLDFACRSAALAMHRAGSEGVEATGPGPTLDTEFLGKELSRPLQGPMVSSEWLARRAGQTAIHGFQRAPHGLRSSEGVDISPGGASKAKAGGTHTKTPARARRNAQSLPPESAVNACEAARPTATQAYQQDDVGTLTAAGPAVQGPAAPAGSSPLAPPTVTTPLPQLVPGMSIRSPVPAVASVLAVEGAKEELQARQEDLDALAQKIKLILDAQVRRYGISD